MNTHLSFSLQPLHPSGLQTVTAFEVVWKKGERREGGMEGGEKNEPWVYLALRQTRQLPPRFLNK